MLIDLELSSFEPYELREEKRVSFRISPRLGHLFRKISTGLIFLPKNCGEDVFISLIPSPIHYLCHGRIMIFAFEIRVSSP